MFEQHQEPPTGDAGTIPAAGEGVRAPLRRRPVWAALLGRSGVDRRQVMPAGARAGESRQQGGALRTLEGAAAELAHDTVQLGADAVHAAEEVGKHVAHGAARIGVGSLHAAQALRREPFWQAQAMLLTVVILYLSLPTKLVEGPTWLMPAAELLLVAGLWFDRPRRTRAEAARERGIVLALLGLVALSNFASLELLVRYLLRGGKAGGHQLLLSSIVIWLTNVAVFALIFWQLDRGGPDRRARCCEKPPDFLFAQMTDSELVRGWHPTFVDYLYTSFTNATAFSPTDTLPLTSTAKLTDDEPVSRVADHARARGGARGQHPRLATR
jgi:hypothetical protein